MGAVSDHLLNQVAFLEINGLECLAFKFLLLNVFYCFVHPQNTKILWIAFLVTINLFGWVRRHWLASLNVLVFISDQLSRPCYYTFIKLHTLRAPRLWVSWFYSWLVRKIVDPRLLPTVEADFLKFFLLASKVAYSNVGRELTWVYSSLLILLLDDQFNLLALGLFTWEALLVSLQQVQTLNRLFQIKSLCHQQFRLFLILIQRII